jgi:hypothetical protein
LCSQDLRAKIRTRTPRDSHDRVGDSGQDVSNQGEADGIGEQDDKPHQRTPGIG